MEIVPNLAQLRAPVIGGIATSSSLVEFRSRAADVRCGAVLLGQSALQGREGVGRGIGRLDAVAAQPGPGWQTLVVHDHGLEEVDYILVLAVLGAVARDVEGGEASCVLRELVL